MQSRAISINSFTSMGHSTLSLAHVAIADKADYAVYVKDENAIVSIPPACGAAGNKLLKVTDATNSPASACDFYNVRYKVVYIIAHFIDKR